MYTLIHSYNNYKKLCRDKSTNTESKPTHKAKKVKLTKETKLKIIKMQ